jgi:hypothetical protein
VAKKQLKTYSDFSKGINDKDAPNLIPPDALVEAQNAIIGRGSVSKRYGYMKYTPSALTSGITKLYDFFRNNGTKEFLSVSNKTLYKDNAGSLSAIAFSTITSLTSDDVQMLTYKNRSIQDVVLLADGGKLKRYNGTDVAEVTSYTPTTQEQTDPGINDLTNLSKFRAITLNKVGRVFAAAHPSIKNRVSFCHLDPTVGYSVYDYWPATHFFDLATVDNDEISEIILFRDAIIALCKRSIWAIYGDGRTLDDYQINKINVPDGCIAPKSVQTVGNDLFYLSDDHVYALFSTEENYVSARIVSEQIEMTLKKISLLDKQKAVGYFYDNKYFLSFPDGTTLVYDVLLGAWSKWTNVKANCFINRDGNLYFSTSTGYIYRFDENRYNDDGVAIPYSVKLKSLDFNFPVQRKKYKNLWIIAKQFDGYNSTFAVTLFVDGSQLLSFDVVDTSTNVGAVWDESDWDDAVWDFAEVIQEERKIGAKGKNIQIQITNDKLDEPVALYGVAVQYKLKKP